MTFDDLPAQTNPVGETIPNGYGGLNWENMGYMNGTVLPTTGYYTGRVSGDYVAFNQFARVASPSDVPFTLNSAYFTSALVDLLDVQVYGYDGAIEIASTRVTVNKTTPTLVNFDWAGLTKVSLIGYVSGENTPQWFAMDNLTITKTVAAAVPLPAAAYGGITLLGLIAAKRARRA